MIVDIVAQGSLLEVKVMKRTMIPPKNGSRSNVPRGTIRGFSRASRLRLIKEMCRIKWSEKNNKLVTLTYPAEYPNICSSKKHLRAFLERWRRQYKEVAAIWKLEFQKRGAPHFHLISPNLPFQEVKMVQLAWGDIIGYEDVFTRIDAFEGDRVVKYVAKYMAKEPKEEEDEAACGYAPLLKPEEKEAAWTGRCWGVHNKPAMPYHARFHTSVDDRIVYTTIRERASEVWPLLRELDSESFSLFVDNAVDWLFLQD